MVGTRIAEARRRTGVKQADLAAAMGDGISRSMVSMIETGQNQPSFARAAEAAQALHVSLDYLAGFTDDPTPASARSNGSPVSYLTNGDRDPALAPNGAPSARPIPIRELAAAAGGGAVDLDETILGYLYFRREWLDPPCGRPHAGRRHQGPRRVDGADAPGRLLDSDGPPPPGAALGPDYVVRTDEGIVVKRARRDGGRWILSSDHPTWPPRPWPADAELISEVRWMARTF